MKLTRNDKIFIVGIIISFIAMLLTTTVVIDKTVNASLECALKYGENATQCVNWLS